MERLVGTISRGVRAPIIRRETTLRRSWSTRFWPQANRRAFRCTTGTLSQSPKRWLHAPGNYAHIDQIAADVRAKLGGETIGVISHPEPQPLFGLLKRHRARREENRADAQLPR